MSDRFVLTHSLIDGIFCIVVEYRNFPPLTNAIAAIFALFPVGGDEREMNDSDLSENSTVYRVYLYNLHNHWIP